MLIAGTISLIILGALYLLQRADGRSDDWR